jgi:hypothetical protein
MMTKTAAFLLVVAGAASAQSNAFMAAYMPRYNAMKQNLVEAAEAMPAEHYGFKLSPTQRAYGEWVEHTIMLMHGSCATAAGKAAPAMDHSAHSADKPKADLVKALRAEADACDAAFKGMTDDSALKAVAVDGKQPAAPVNAMVGLLTNMASHYGNMVGYLRAKGITPPSTARGMKK